MSLDQRVRAELPGATVAQALDELADLTGYPSWLGIVLDARPEEQPGTSAPSWLVDLGARVGPLRRAKRLRMVRVLLDRAAGKVAFEREEGDGEEHGRWRLDAVVHTAVLEGAEGAVAELRLRYDGSSALIGALGPLLRAEASRAGPRLAARLRTA